MVHSSVRLSCISQWR